MSKHCTSFSGKNLTREAVTENLNVLDYDTYFSMTDLLLENKINNKTDVLVFVESKKTDIQKRLKKRNNFNQKLYNKFKEIQLPLDYKRKK